MAATLPTLSLVVPVYNSEATLALLAERLEAVLPSIASQWELILVNDGSRDRSWEVVRSLAAARPWIRGFDLARNFGQHNALLAGIRRARHEIVVTLDDDLQHPPEEIEKLLAKIAAGWHVVYGSPEKEVHSPLRNLASQCTKISLQGALGAETARRVSAFRAFRRELREAFADYHGAFVSIDVLLTWSTQRFTAVRVRHEPRASGESNYTFFKLLTHALDMLTGFSTLPLQIASWIGFFFVLFGAGVLAWVVGRYLIAGSTVQGFPFLASIIALFSGAQLFALGLIGEYLARMHFRLMGKPSFVVRESTAPEAAAPAAGSERGGELSHGRSR